jgi:hypothetical protein
MPKDISRLVDGIDDSNDIFELAFERIVIRIAALPAAPAVQGVY